MDSLDTFCPGDYIMCLSGARLHETLFQFISVFYTHTHTSFTISPGAEIERVTRLGKGCNVELRDNVVVATKLRKPATKQLNN